MPSKKRGRPRKFEKEAFLEEIRIGRSREEACKQLGISYKTLEYHIGKDRRFWAMVRRAEHENFRIRSPYKKFSDKFERKHVVPYSVFMDILKSNDPDKWFKTSKYHLRIRTDFNAYLKHLAKSNPKKLWPAIRKLREWYKWNPEKRAFIRTAFLADETTLLWLLWGTYEPSKVDAWIKDIDILFEKYKQDAEFHAYIGSLSPSEIEALAARTRSHIEMMHEQEKRRYLEHRKANRIQK